MLQYLCLADDVEEDAEVEEVERVLELANDLQSSETEESGDAASAEPEEKPQKKSPRPQRRGSPRQRRKPKLKLGERSRMAKLPRLGSSCTTLICF